MFTAKATNAIEKEAVKKLTRLGKKETLFRLVGDAPQSWRTVKHVFDARVKKYLNTKYGDRLEIIANEDFQAAAKRVAVVDNRFSAN